MSPSVVVFCMQGVGHITCLLPVIAALVGRGCAVFVFTDAAFRHLVEACGATFVDLFARYPWSAVDATSRPVPVRNVTFAGVYGDRLAHEVAALLPRLVIHDTYAVIGPVVARRLGLPYVNVIPNHGLVPERAAAALRDDPRVVISDACWAAVQQLRAAHDMPSASPFSYVETRSPYLNLCAEPREFVAAAAQAAMQPLEFFGCLMPELHSTVPSSPLSPPRRRRRMFVSFGTVVWWYFQDVALAALRVISETLAELDVDVVISLADQALDPSQRASLRCPNVDVVDYADQWAALAEADGFITHHGINSTHEAIFQATPMLSYPFFGDQPALARRCQELGLALPLVEEPLQPIVPARLLDGIEQLERNREDMSHRLAEARAWEQRTIAGRGAIVDRMLRRWGRGNNSPPDSSRL